MNKQLLGLLAKFVVTKGLESDTRKVVNIDNPMYYATDVVNATIGNTTDRSNVFAEIKADLLSKIGEEDLDTMEQQGLVEFEELDFSNFDIVTFDIDTAVVSLRISRELIEACMQYGKFVVSATGTKNSPLRYYYQNNNGNRIPLLCFDNKKNNIAVIRQDNGNDLFFLDGFTTTENGVYPEKDVYVNEVILKAYLSVMTMGEFKADGFNRGISGSLKQIFDFFIYKVKLGFNNPKVSYVSLIGGRNRENWNLRADVVRNLPGQVCWLKETEKFDSVISRVEFIASNPSIAKTSMTQGEKFMIMNTPEEARTWEAKFIQGKYDISATIFPTMKVDKPFEKYNLVFGNIVNAKDNNAYGNALWQEDYAGKTYCVVDNIPVRIKYSTQKAESDISIVDNNGNDVDKWIIAPIEEMSSENNFEAEDKMDNVLQLFHMGLTPERVVITVDGLSYEAIMFRGIYQYIDYLTSSDYNVDKSFELKPYSTMFSCIANHIACKDETRLEGFIDRLKGIINQDKLNQIANLAGKEVKLARVLTQK